MKNYNNLNAIYKSIWSLISYKKKILFFTFIALSILISILEIIGIASLLNIMSFITSGDLPVLVKLKNYLDLDNYLVKDFFYIIAIFFILITLITMAAKFCLTLVNAKISFGIVNEFNNLIFNKLAYLKFSDHKKLSINTSISNFSRLGEISILIITNLTALSSTIIASIIFISLLFVDLNIVLACSFFFLLIYFMLIEISKNKLLENSKSISQSVNHKLDSDQPTNLWILSNPSLTVLNLLGELLVPISLRSTHSS
jgi:ABC-type multidrug transport system fused ATPase/permease subunit